MRFTVARRKLIDKDYRSLQVDEKNSMSQATVDGGQITHVLLSSYVSLIMKGETKSLNNGQPKCTPAWTDTSTIAPVHRVPLLPQLTSLQLKLAQMDDRLIIMERKLARFIDQSTTAAAPAAQPLRNIAGSQQASIYSS